jgi:hypothetical protein
MPRITTKGETMLGLPGPSRPITVTPRPLTLPKETPKTVPQVAPKPVPVPEKVPA